MCKGPEAVRSQIHCKETKLAVAEGKKEWQEVTREGSATVQHWQVLIRTFIFIVTSAEVMGDC